MHKHLLGFAITLALTGGAALASEQCEYRGGDGITARPTGDGGYDIGYGLAGFDDVATDDHCQIVVKGDSKWAAERERWAVCDQGFEGPYIQSGSTLDAIDGGIIVLLNSVLYRVCR